MYFIHVHEGQVPNALEKLPHFTKWKVNVLGGKLGIDPFKLDEIQADNSHTYEHTCRY